MDIAHSLVEFFFSLLYVSLQFLVILVEIRYLINWFLNVNPFFEPFVTLWAWTNPVFNFGRRWYPRVFGLDITPIINYKVLSIIVDVCDDIVSYLAGRNNETGGGPINEEPFGLGVDVLGFPDSEIGVFAAGDDVLVVHGVEDGVYLLHTFGVIDFSRATVGGWEDSDRFVEA